MVSPWCQKGVQVEAKRVTDFLVLPPGAVSGICSAGILEKKTSDVSCFEERYFMDLWLVWGVCVCVF